MMESSLDLIFRVIRVHRRRRNLRLSEKVPARQLSFSDQINSFRYPNMHSDSFTVDMEGFTHLGNKDATINSSFNLQRSLSRKGSQRWGDKKMNLPSAGNERDSSLVLFSSSPRAALVGGAGATTPEKAIVVTVGTADQSVASQVNHQITIVSSCTTTSATCTTTSATTERRLSGKRFSFRRTSSSWTIDPRRILFFFATLSSMGTILLIYFTLSMNKHSTADHIILN